MLCCSYQKIYRNCFPILAIWHGFGVTAVIEEVYGSIILKSREELLVFYRAHPPVVDRGMLTRYGGYRGNKIPGAHQN